MEKNANYALVGLSTLILTLALIIFVIWLARLNFNSEYDIYDIVFEGPVRGITEGGEVHFNGIKVGEVTRIELDSSNPKNVIARARVTADVPIRTDSYATLEPQGITGLNYVQIIAGTSTKELLKDESDKRCTRMGGGCVPRLGSRRSAFSDLIEGGGTVLTRSIEALDRVNRVLSDQNIRTFSAALSDVQSVTAELRERKALIADVQNAVQRLEEATAEIALLSKTTRDVVDGDGRLAIRNLAEAAKETQATAREIRILAEKLQGPTSDFATNGLPQVTAAVIQLQTSAESLERLINEVQSSPTGALGKPPAKEVKIPK